MALFHRTPLTRALGILDMMSLIGIVGTLITYHVILQDVPWVSWIGWFYVILWVNKVVFTRCISAAFPAVFGLSETGVISLNPTWYTFSLAVFVILILLSLIESNTIIVILSTIACGRATVPPLVMARLLATSFDRRAAVGTTK